MLQSVQFFMQHCYTKNQRCKLSRVTLSLVYAEQKGSIGEHKGRIRFAQDNSQEELQKYLHGLG